MTYRPDNQVKWIVIHYSATPVERVTSYDAIEKSHIQRGFKEIGYHAYGPRTGGTMPGRDLSQPGRFEVGAHSKGENSRSVGYCFEGGVSIHDMNHGFDTRTPAQIDAMIRWIDVMLERFGGDGIDPTKGPVVIGHRDMPGAATQCPGFDAAAWWATVVEDRKYNKPPSSGPAWLTALVSALAGLFSKKGR